MHPKDVVARVADLIAPVLEAERYELLEIVYRSEAGRWVLRLFLDRPEGVTLDDCAFMSRRIEDLIEVEGNLPNAYRLEVSSAGLDRVLNRPEHFRRFTGKTVRVKRAIPEEGRKNYRGRILCCEQEIVELEEPEGNRVRIPLSEIAVARLEIDTPIGQKRPPSGRPSRKRKKG